MRDAPVRALEHFGADRGVDEVAGARTGEPASRARPRLRQERGWRNFGSAMELTRPRAIPAAPSVERDGARAHGGDQVERGAERADDAAERSRCRRPGRRARPELCAERSGSRMPKGEYMPRNVTGKNRMANAAARLPAFTSSIAAASTNSIRRFGEQRQHQDVCRADQHRGAEHGGGTDNGRRATPPIR